jgi:phospholipid-translocating ATPase
VSIATEPGYRVEGNLEEVKQQLNSRSNDETTIHFFNCVNLNHDCIAVDSKVRVGQIEFSGPSVDESCLLDMAQ